jgi:hypothetical protein
MILRTVESFFWIRSNELQGPNPAYEKNQIQAMFQAIQLYRQVAILWMKHPKAKHILQGKQRSEEVLVLWIGACLAHQQFCHEFPALREFGIPLKWQDLRVLLISGEEVIKAVQNVAAYIRRFTKPNKTLFLIQNPTPTFEMAITFVEKYSEDIRSWLQEEIQIGEEALESNWQVVKKKKKQVAEIRNELEKLRGDLIGLEAQLAIEANTLDAIIFGKDSDKVVYEYGYYHVKKLARRFDADHASCEKIANTIRGLTDEIQKLKYTISNREMELKTALTPPAPVIHVLPLSSKEEAYIILFFFSMPVVIDIFGELCQISQSTLVGKNNADCLSEYDVMESVL